MLKTRLSPSIFGTSKYFCILQSCLGQQVFLPVVNCSSRQAWKMYCVFPAVALEYHIKQPNINSAIDYLIYLAVMNVSSQTEKAQSRESIYQGVNPCALFFSLQWIRSLLYTQFTLHIIVWALLLCKYMNMVLCQTVKLLQ